MGVIHQMLKEFLEPVKRAFCKRRTVQGKFCWANQQRSTTAGLAESKPGRREGLKTGGKTTSSEIFLNINAFFMHGKLEMINFKAVLLISFDLWTMHRLSLLLKQ